MNNREKIEYIEKIRVDELFDDSTILKVDPITDDRPFETTYYKTRCKLCEQIIEYSHITQGMVGMTDTKVLGTLADHKQKHLEKLMLEELRT